MWAEDPDEQALTLDLPEGAKVRSAADAGTARLPAGLVTITLNGEAYQLDGPVSVSTLLAKLAIDSRRVAVEHNLMVVRRALFDTTIIVEGDEVEIVNFVGGGASAR
jgi:sulfur carrier protein